MDKEQTETKIKNLHKELIKITDNATEEDINRIMYKIILFLISEKQLNENMLHNLLWEYFLINKTYLMKRIP